MGWSGVWGDEAGWGGGRRSGGDREAWSRMEGGVTKLGAGGVKGVGVGGMGGHRVEWSRVGW